MKAIKSALIGIALLGAAALAQAQSEQFIPVLSYRVGPYAAGGSGYYGGAIDYWTLVNMNGGINGVKLMWEECETEYNASKGVECYERLKKKNGGASTVEPLSTGIAYGLFDLIRPLMKSAMPGRCSPLYILTKRSSDVFTKQSAFSIVLPCSTRHPSGSIVTVHFFSSSREQ